MVGFGCDVLLRPAFGAGDEPYGALVEVEDWSVGRVDWVLQGDVSLLSWEVEAMISAAKYTSMSVLL